MIEQSGFFWNLINFFKAQQMGCVENIKIKVGFTHCQKHTSKVRLACPNNSFIEYFGGSMNAYCAACLGLKPKPDNIK
jgi:hypothetical protein